MSQIRSVSLPWLVPRIAVVELFGVLGTTIRGPEYGRMLSALCDDSRVRAVVVDIDSPGGSAPVAEQLHLGIAKVAARKPVIAFIRGAGLSGGYLMSCAAAKVVALPTAMVGSIGVIAIRPVISELLQRLGVRVFVTKAGTFKDMFQPFREPTDEEQKKVQALMDKYYDWFVDAVARTRQLEPEKVRSLATGEVFTAWEGKELGLVDELGDLDTALDMATELGRVPRRLAYLRPRRALLERLMGRVAGGLVQEMAAEVERRLLSRIEFRA
ncbi:MAG: signal peptide peptidase SppA [Dehalococcoidia bacterium]